MSAWSRQALAAPAAKKLRQSGTPMRNSKLTSKSEGRLQTVFHPLATEFPATSCTHESSQRSCLIQPRRCSLHLVFLRHKEVQRRIVLHLKTLAQRFVAFAVDRCELDLSFLYSRGSTELRSARCSVKMIAAARLHVASSIVQLTHQSKCDVFNVLCMLLTVCAPRRVEF